MAKFHIAQSGKNAGMAVQCQAKNKCRLKDSEGNPVAHGEFASPGEARKWSEQAQKAASGGNLRKTIAKNAKEKEMVRHFGKEYRNFSTELRYHADEISAMSLEDMKSQRFSLPFDDKTLDLTEAEVLYRVKNKDPEALAWAMDPRKDKRGFNNFVHETVDGFRSATGKDPLSKKDRAAKERLMARLNNATT